LMAAGSFFDYARVHAEIKASRAKFALTLHLPVWVIEMPCLNDPSLSFFFFHVSPQQ